MVSRRRMLRARDDFITHHRPRRCREGRRIAALPSIDAAIRDAVFPCGRKHSHQRRLNLANMGRLVEGLLEDSAFIEEASTFERLHDLVSTATSGLWEDAALLKYDVAQRLGTFVGIEPDAVYVHRGTAVGAAAIGLPGRGSVSMRQIPEELSSLSASELEDCLCIFGPYLAGIAPAPTGACACDGKGACNEAADDC